MNRTAILLALVVLNLTTFGKAQYDEVPELATGGPGELPQPPSAGGLPQPGGAQGGRIFPVVAVDNQQNKSRVDVHVPIFFDMTNDKDRNTGAHKLDLSVLGGLVTVNRDRGRDGNDQNPLVVTVFGIPVYQGTKPASPSRSFFERLRAENMARFNGGQNQIEQQRLQPAKTDG